VRAVAGEARVGLSDGQKLHHAFDGSRLGVRNAVMMVIVKVERLVLEVEGSCRRRGLFLTKSGA